MVIFCMMVSEYEKAEKVKKLFPKGTRLRLRRMVDDSPVPEGTHGTVKGVSDMGMIQMVWDNGSNLSLIYGVDEFSIEGAV